MKTPCPVTMTDLTAYVFGELPQKQAEEVWAHLETCEACRAEVAAQSAARDALCDALTADAQTPYALTPSRLAVVLATPPATSATKKIVRRARVHWSRILAWAATLLLFLGIYSAVYYQPFFGRSLGGATGEYMMLDGEKHSFAVGGFAENLKMGSKVSDGQTESWDAESPTPSSLKDELVPIKIKYPKPQFTGTPKEIRSSNLETHEERDARTRTPMSPEPSRVLARGVESRTASAAGHAPAKIAGGELFVVADAPASLVAGTEMLSEMAGVAEASERRTGSASTIGRQMSGPSQDGRFGERLLPNAPVEALESVAESLSRKEQKTKDVVYNLEPRSGSPRPAPPLTAMAIRAEKESGARGDVALGVGRVPNESVSELKGIRMYDSDEDISVAESTPVDASKLDVSGKAERGRFSGEGWSTSAEVAVEEILEKGKQREAGYVGQTVAPGVVAGSGDIVSGKKLRAKKPVPVPQVNPFVATVGQPLSTFAIGTDTASYMLTRQSLGNGMLPDPAVVRVEEFVNAFDYKDSAPERTTFRIIAEGAPSPFGRDTQLVRLAIKGKRLGREEQRPANLIFLVDASGSMAQPDRMGAVQLALDQLLQGLREEDQIQIVTFNETARLVQSQVSASQQQEIMANFNRVQTTGPTSLEGGMNMAYQQAVATFQPGAENRVILVTDGVANLGSSEAGDILAQIDESRRQGIRLSVFGVGRGTYNDTLLQQLANKGDGTYRFLDSPDVITDAFVNDLSATLYTIASDAKVQVEWFPRAVTEYRQLGYEARALTTEQFRDDTVVAGQIGSGQAASALYELRLADMQAMPPDAALGIVRIRFRPSEGGAVEEISRPILRSDLAESFGKARPEFQLAAAAAGFAEHLRRSPYAPTQGYRDLATLIRPAAQQLYLDTRFDELVRLISAAAAITQ